MHGTTRYANLGGFKWISGVERGFSLLISLRLLSRPPYSEYFYVSLSVSTAPPRVSGDAAGPYPGISSLPPLHRPSRYPLQWRLGHDIESLSTLPSNPPHPASHYLRGISNAGISPR